MTIQSFEVNSEGSRANHIAVGQINRYWLERGYKANARVELRDFVFARSSKWLPAVKMTVPVVVSDLINGAPRGYAPRRRTKR